MKKQGKNNKTFHAPGRKFHILIKHSQSSQWFEIIFEPWLRQKNLKKGHEEYLKFAVDIPEWQ